MYVFQYLFNKYINEWLHAFFIWFVIYIYMHTNAKLKYDFLTIDINCSIFIY